MTQIHSMNEFMTHKPLWMMRACVWHGASHSWNAYESPIDLDLSSLFWCTHARVMSHTRIRHITRVKTRLLRTNTRYHANSFRNEPVFHQERHTSIKRALYSIKRALYFIKRALYPIKRALYSIKRALNDHSYEYAISCVWDSYDM